MHTFHLPLRETTITLEDVVVNLGSQLMGNLLRALLARTWYLYVRHCWDPCHQWFKETQSRYLG